MEEGAVGMVWRCHRDGVEEGAIGKVWRCHTEDFIVYLYFQSSGSVKLS